MSPLAGKDSYALHCLIIHKVCSVNTLISADKWIILKHKLSSLVIIFTMSSQCISVHVYHNYTVMTVISDIHKFWRSFYLFWVYCKTYTLRKIRNVYVWFLIFCKASIRFVLLIYCWNQPFGTRNSGHLNLLVGNL